MSKNDKNNRSSKEKRNSGIGMVGTAIVLAIILRPWTLIKLAIIAGVAFAVGKAVGVMSSGLDLTTHNKQDEKPEKEFEDISKTGNDHADDVIAQGQEMLRQIREANDAIRDPEITRQLYELEDKCTQIFRTVAEKPEKAGQIRKFMNYYLPTTLKIVSSYKTMQDRGVSSYEMAEHRATLRRGLTLVNQATQKQLDNLYKDTMLDISADIDVLEQMLKRDGFVDGDLSERSISAQEEARTAAAAILADHSVPTLQVEPVETADKNISQVDLRKNTQQKY